VRTHLALDGRQAWPNLADQRKGDAEARVGPGVMHSPQGVLQFRGGGSALR